LLTSDVYHLWARGIVNHKTCFMLLLFSDINISEGSVATCLRCRRIFYYNFARNLLLSP